MKRIYDPHHWPQPRRYERPISLEEWFSACVSIGCAVVAGWLFGILQASTWIHH
jgi:hypothetical protein